MQGGRKKLMVVRLFDESTHYNMAIKSLEGIPGAFWDWSFKICRRKFMSLFYLVNPINYSDQLKNYLSCFYSYSL
jgi:hypothetical protein